MKVPPQTVVIYETEEGKNPFADWFKALRDKAGKARILARLERVEKGNFGDSKPIQDGLFELRINFGPGYRVYYGRLRSAVVVLVCGGDKSTQQKDIEKALTLWNDHRRRYANAE